MKNLLYIYIYSLECIAPIYIDLHDALVIQLLYTLLLAEQAKPLSNCGCTVHKIFEIKTSSGSKVIKLLKSFSKTSYRIMARRR